MMNIHQVEIYNFFDEKIPYLGTPIIWAFQKRLSTQKKIKNL